MYLFLVIFSLLCSRSRTLKHLSLFFLKKSENTALKDTYPSNTVENVINCEVISKVAWFSLLSAGEIDGTFLLYVVYGIKLDNITQGHIEKGPLSGKAVHGMVQKMYVRKMPFIHA